MFHRSAPVFDAIGTVQCVEFDFDGDASGSDGVKRQRFSDADSGGFGGGFGIMEVAFRVGVRIDGGEEFPFVFSVIGGFEGVDAVSDPGAYTFFPAGIFAWVEGVVFNGVYKFEVFFGAVRGGAEGGFRVDLDFFKGVIVFSGDAVAGEIIADDVFFGGFFAGEEAVNAADSDVFDAGGLGEFFGFDIFGGFDHVIVPNGRGEGVAGSVPAHCGSIGVAGPNAGDDFGGVADGPSIVGENFVFAEFFVAGAGFGGGELAGEAEANADGISLVG